MDKLLKPAIVFFCCIVLTACQPVMTQEYLLTHADVLKKEIERCHEPGIKSSEDAAHCEVIVSAAEKFIKLLNEQQRDPEEFGVRVMDAQSDCAIKKAALDQANQQVAMLLQQQASAADVQQATAVVKKAEASYLASRYQVDVLHAVIGVNSPE